MTSLEQRARLHAALSDPSRLAIVDHLAVSDASPGELGRRFDIPANLLAHHLDVLDAAGLIDRFVSSGDRRRRYVRLHRRPFADLGPAVAGARRTVLFVCTHNSARSQLAAAMWTGRTGGPARSAGTHPADRVHPGAVAAAARIGLDLAGARPRLLDGADDLSGAVQVVTVCDRAHEELEPGDSWWHWSIPDPIERGDAAAFDDVIADLDTRMNDLAVAS